MTTHVKIQGVIPRIQYTANGTLATYTFPFAIFSAADIEVYLDNTKQADTAYSVSGERNSDGGSVTFTTAPASGTIVTIIRHLSIERTSDFQEGGALRADTLNDELDYQIACQQQIAENLNRSMVLPPYAVATGVDLTLPTPSAGKAIVWNSDGTNLENSTVAVNALESTLKGYKETAESAASTATTKAGIASDKADIATAKAQIATDKAAEAVSTLSDKANKAMDNLSTVGKTAVATLALPSNDSESLTYSASDDFHIAPANGYVFVLADGSAGQMIRIVVSDETATNYSEIISADKNVFQVMQRLSSAASEEIMAPVRKGMTFSAKPHSGSYNSVGDYKFIYAQGEI